MLLFKRYYLGGHAAVRLDFENRDRPRDVDQIARQRRTPWIYHQRLAEAHDAFEMAVPHHEHIHRTAEMAFHRAMEHLLGGFVRSRERMRESDPYASNFDQMCHANTLVNFKLMLMSVEALIAVADRRDYRRDSGKFVKHAIDINITRMHNEVDAVKNLEHTPRQMLAGLRYMSIRN